MGSQIISPKLWECSFGQRSRDADQRVGRLLCDQSEQPDQLERKPQTSDAMLKAKMSRQMPEYEAKLSQFEMPDLSNRRPYQALRLALKLTVFGAFMVILINSA